MCSFDELSDPWYHTSVCPISSFRILTPSRESIFVEVVISPSVACVVATGTVVDDLFSFVRKRFRTQKGQNTLPHNYFFLKLEYKAGRP